MSGDQGTLYFLASDPVEHTGVRRIYPLEKVCTQAMHKREEEPVALWGAPTRCFLSWGDFLEEIRSELLLSEAPPTKPAMAVHCLSISMSALVGSPTCTHGFKYSFPSLLLSLQDIVVNPYYTELLCLACRVVSECVQGP